MNKTLIKHQFTWLLLAFLVFFIVFMASIFISWQRQTRTAVSLVLDEVVTSYTHFDDTPTAFVEAFSSDNDRRITILNPQGIVLADTHDETIGTDKSERPEIKEFGRLIIRRSKTIDVELVYLATQLDDQTIIRVAVPLSTHLSIYLHLMWILTGALLIILYISYVRLKTINKHILEPWDKVKQGLKKLSTGEYQVMALTSPYPEINDLLHEMNHINLETDKHLHSIETYQVQLKEILNELKQGVLLFNQNEELVYFNQDASHYFHLSDDAYDKPSYYLIRDLSLKEAISMVNKDHQNRIFDIKHEGKTLETKFFHVNAEGRNKTQATVLVLMRDVTHERAIEEIKRDFFSHTSHELKSPLTAIKGYAELIELGLIKEDEYKQIAHNIVKQTDMMTALVEDMLMLSRLENLKEKRYSRVNLNHILHEVVSQLQPQMTEKQMEIKIKESKIDAICDPIDIQKLFKNLIENAIKYSDPQKRVDIGLSKTESGIMFSVKDQGVGIALEHQQRVFERFYRVDKGRIDGGTGLGLAIVKHISLKYEGTIDLKSSLTRGTTIVVKLTLETM